MECTLRAAATENDSMGFVIPSEAKDLIAIEKPRFFVACGDSE